MAFGPKPTALLRMFGKEMTSFYSCNSRHWRTACCTLPPPAEDKSSARELGAVLCLRIWLGTAAIHHASITSSDFKGKVAKDLLFLRVFWQFIYCHLPGQWDMFTCLLCQLSSGSSNMITTLECSEMLSGSSYLLWSPGHFTTVKKKTPPKHHPAPNHLRCGARSGSSILLSPCYCSLLFHQWYLFFPQALPHLGSGRLRVRGFTWGRWYLPTQERMWKDSFTPPPPSLQPSSEPFYRSWRLRFKRSASPGEARTVLLPPALPSALCKHHCALSPQRE